MTKAVQPAISADEIAFELERFEREGDRLILSGRWFGVRGRRFVRPTLIPLGGSALSRVLADLEHKPWAAEDGGHWEAAFPWEQNGSGAKFELSVAPDIAIRLPSPSGKLGRPRRLVALPRRPSIIAAWRPPDDQVEVRPSPEGGRGEPASPAGKPPQAELAALRTQLEAARSQLEATRSELADREGKLGATMVELSAAVASHDDAARDAAEADTTREQLNTERHQLTADFDELARQRDQLLADLDLAEQTIAELRSELQQTKLAVDEATRQRDELARQRDDVGRQRDEAGRQLVEATRQREEEIASRGAALVMRGATRATVHHEHRYGWWGPTLAILALLAVVFAILIVVHAL